MITTQTIMEMRLATLNAPTDAGSANTPSTRTGTAASETWINSTTPSGNAVRQSAGNVCASDDLEFAAAENVTPDGDEPHSR